MTLGRRLPKMSNTTPATMMSSGPCNPKAMGNIDALLSVLRQPAAAELRERETGVGERGNEPGESVTPIWGAAGIVIVRPATEPSVSG
jgi:hypothetical protein